MPKFTNTSLSYLELRYTSLTGGDISGDTSYVIPEKTFEQCKNLQYMLLQSGNLLTTPIHPNAFSYTPNLYYLWYISYGRTTGNFPSVGACPSLTWVVVPYNNFTGAIPNFAANPGVYYVDVSNNSFSGAIPAFKNLSNLTYLYLYNNQFTALQKFQNLPNLVYFYAHNNKLTGTIPDFGDCPRLYYLILFNNQLTNYTPGAFSKLYNINYIDLSGNQLSQQAVNSIIGDLFANYNAIKRGGVTINLRQNALPSGIALDQINFLRTKGWNITYE
jgi:Leucine-rich repeat (LRR) protein